MTYVFGYHFQSEDPLIQLEEDLKWIDIFHPFLSYEMVNIIFVMIATNSKFHSSSITLYHSRSYFFLVFPFCYLPFFHSSPLFFFFLFLLCYQIGWNCPKSINYNRAQSMWADSGSYKTEKKTKSDHTNTIVSYRNQPMLWSWHRTKISNFRYQTSKSPFRHRIRQVHFCIPIHGMPEHPTVPSGGKEEEQEEWGTKKKARKRMTRKRRTRRRGELPMKR